MFGGVKERDARERRVHGRAAKIRHGGAQPPLFARQVRRKSGQVAQRRAQVRFAGVIDEGGQRHTLGQQRLGQAGGVPAQPGAFVRGGGEIKADGHRGPAFPARRVPR